MAASAATGDITSCVSLFASFLFLFVESSLLLPLLNGTIFRLNFVSASHEIADSRTPATDTHIGANSLSAFDRVLRLANANTHHGGIDPLEVPNKSDSFQSSNGLLISPQLLQSAFKYPNRMRRQSDMFWSRDEAIRTLDQIELSLKSAIDRCGEKESPIVTSVSYLEYLLPVRVLEPFSSEVAGALHGASILTMFHRADVQVDSSRGGDMTSFYSWFARALLDSSSDIVHSATVVIDRSNVFLAPQAYRIAIAGQSRVNLHDIAKTVKSSEWYSTILQHSQPTSQQCKMNVVNASNDAVLNESRDVVWTSSFVNCTVLLNHGLIAGSWLVSLTVPIYGCDANDKFSVQGAIKLDIDLNKVSVNQCPGSHDAFSDTHRCPHHTFCKKTSRPGLRRANYMCVCDSGYYLPQSDLRPANVRYFDGQEVENRLGHHDDQSQIDLSCFPCPRGCAVCDDANSSCYDDLGTTRVVLLGLQVFVLTSCIVAGAVTVRLRKTKLMKASFWLLLEVIIIGLLMLESTVVLEYLDQTGPVCVVISWFRELGFVIVYGSLQLKIYRVLAEFQSRKAQRILLRDKDLLKYLLMFIIIVLGYLVTWTVVSLDHVTSVDDRHLVEARNVTGTNVVTSYCTLGWWHYVIELGELLFLAFGVYLCYCVRAAPSAYLETRFISFAIINELIMSSAYYIARHSVWSNIQPNFIFVLSFLRCHVTATITFVLVIVTKIWFVHRPPNDRSCRRRTYSTSEAATSGECMSAADQIKHSSDSGVDVGEINLADMNPDDIRAELRRLYTQLQVYKTKSMKRDNPHISKRRSARKSTHRRFSLQAAFHYKHRLQQATTVEQSIGVEGHDLEVASRTPEESTNSVEVAGHLTDDSPRTAIATTHQLKR